MIWQRVKYTDVLAATALHGKDKGMILGRQMAQLRRLLDRYYGGCETRELKNFDRISGDPRDRHDYQGAVAVQTFVNNWLICFAGIHQQIAYRFDVRTQLVAVLYHGVDPKVREQSSVGDLAHQFGVTKSRVYQILDGCSPDPRYQNKKWPHGRPGVNDWLVACERRITNMSIKN